MNEYVTAAPLRDRARREENASGSPLGVCTYYTYAGNEFQKDPKDLQLELRGITSGGDNRQM